VSSSKLELFFSVRRSTLLLLVLSHRGIKGRAATTRPSNIFGQHCTALQCAAAFDRRRSCSIDVHGAGGGGDVASPTPAARSGEWPAAVTGRCCHICPPCRRGDRWSLRCTERSIWPAPPVGIRMEMQHRPWIGRVRGCAMPNSLQSRDLRERDFIASVGCHVPVALPPRPARHDSEASFRSPRQGNSCSVKQAGRQAGRLRRGRGVLPSSQNK